MSDFPPVPPGAGLGGVPPAQYPPGPPLAPPASPVPPGAVRPGLAWVEPTPPTLPPRRRVPRWVVAVAVLAVIALIGGVVGVAISDGGDDVASSPFERDVPPPATDPDQPPTTETPTTDPDEPVDPGDFQAIVDDIEAFVAEERGLPFLREVTVELAADDEFEARLLADFDEDAADIEREGRVLQALGLVEPGTDLVAVFRELLGVGVVGFYDTETDELVVRGTSASPYVRTVIAHELTHALDDQHFELDRPALDEAADESSFGFTGLVEGNAVRVENAYRESLTPEEQQAASAEEQELGAGFDFDAIPLVLFESLSAPYILGPELVADLLEAGGQERLDAAFVAPPTTSESLVDPTTYLEGQGVVPVPPPVADGEEIDRSMLGALGLAQLLGEATFILGGVGSVAESVDGWGGDGYVVWNDGDRACMRANLVGDTPEDTTEIGEALLDWADDPGFVVSASVLVTDDVVTLTSCG